MLTLSNIKDHWLVTAKTACCFNKYFDEEDYNILAGLKKADFEKLFRIDELS